MSGERLRARREDLLVLLATGLFSAVLCFVPPTIFESADYVLYSKPTFHFLADAVRAGRLPLWNPYIGLGRPFLADMQNAVFYPPMYLILIGEKSGLFLLVWLHCLLAVFGMRRLASALHAGRWQGYFMAFSFLASGPLTARWVTGQTNCCWGLSYLPWLFYCALRMEERWQSRRIALYAVFLAMQFLCGHPQVFWFSAIGQAVFIVSRALRLPLHEAIRDAWQDLRQFGTACVWCAGLVAVVFLPMLELVKEGNRSGASPAFADSYSLTWKDLGSLFSPLRSGDVNWESNLLVGTIVVILGLAGLCLVRERNVRGLLGVLVIALLIAAGNSTPFFGFFYKWLPGFAGFRIHARAALLVVLVLICAAGIWLSRPHPRLRARWTSLFGVPTRYALIGLVLLQSLDLLQGSWAIKRVYTDAANMILKAPPEHLFEPTLVAGLRKAGLMEPSRPPPRVCVSPSLVPVDYGMIYRYSNFDADCSLFLRRPWDYLHTVLGIPPPIEKGSLSRQVYSYGPLPYHDLALAAGMDPRSGELTVAVAPDPRAFLVYGAEVADYDTALNRLAQGHDVHRSALLEKPLAEPLRPENSLPRTPASIRRFEPNSLLVDLDAKQSALLVLAEAWYPGWRAEIDGRVCASVPANIWMRAIPVPAGRHQVRLYFRQNYLLPGLLISLVSAGLLLAVLAMPGRGMPPTPGKRQVIAVPAASRADGNRRLKREARPLTRQPSAFSAHWQLLRALAAGALGVSLVAMIGIQRMRVFHAEQSAVDAEAQCHLAMTLHLQHQTAQAIAHYTEALRLKPDHNVALNNLAWIRAADAQAEFRDGPEAVRLAQRACELTRYQAPAPLETLAAAYAEAGRFDDALAIAERARQLALAAAQPELAERPMKMLKLFTGRQPYREPDRN
jgi:tetratricopeptide (TPR) repeat protein